MKSYVLLDPYHHYILATMFPSHETSVLSTGEQCHPTCYYSIAINMSVQKFTPVLLLPAIY